MTRFVRLTCDNGPGRFDARHAPSPGVRAEADFEEIAQIHVENEVGGAGTTRVGSCVSERA